MLHKCHKKQEATKPSTHQSNYTQPYDWCVLPRQITSIKNTSSFFRDCIFLLLSRIKHETFVKMYDLFISIFSETFRGLSDARNIFRTFSEYYRYFFNNSLASQALRIHPFKKIICTSFLFILIARCIRIQLHCRQNDEKKVRFRSMSFRRVRHRISISGNNKIAQNTQTYT